MKKNPDKETDSIPDEGFHDWWLYSQMLPDLSSNTYNAMPLISTLLSNFLPWLPYLPTNGLVYRQTQSSLRQQFTPLPLSVAHMNLFRSKRKNNPLRTRCSESWCDLPDFVPQFNTKIRGKLLAMTATCATSCNLSNWLQPGCCCSNPH